MNSPTHSPWLTIWFQPRATIRWVLRTTPNQTIWLLAAIAGIDNALTRAAIMGEGEYRAIFSIIGSALWWGTIWGMVRLLLTAGIVTWVGRKLGGVATMNHSVVALAWSSVPQGLGLLLWIPELLLLGEGAFGATPLLSNENSIEIAIGWGFALIGIVVGIWQIALTIITVAEVHQFSIPRSLFTLMVPLVVVVVPLLFVLNRL